MASMEIRGLDETLSGRRAVIAFKTIKPSPFRSSVFRDEIRSEAERVRDKMFEDFDKTTATWKHKPIFAGGVSLAAGTVTIEIKTNDEIYGYVTEGTRPHIIRPVQARALRFWSKSVPKTLPRWIGSRQSSVGGKLLYRQEVHHPGTQARLFHETIAKAWRPKFKSRMQSAYNRAAKKSGHGK